MDLDQYNRVDLEHIIERQQPVIEAGKKLRQEYKDADQPPYRWRSDPEMAYRLASFFEAVEALQAAERGE
jgi:hypothetical protein